MTISCVWQAKVYLEFCECQYHHYPTAIYSLYLYTKNYFILGVSDVLLKKNQTQNLAAEGISQPLVSRKSFNKQKRTMKDRARSSAQEP